MSASMRIRFGVSEIYVEADDIASLRVAMNNLGETKGPSFLPSPDKLDEFLRENFGLCQHVVIDDKVHARCRP